MPSISDPKHEAMRSKRADLSRVIVELYDDVGDKAARRLQAAFLRYEGAVLELLQDDLNTIDELIKRVERTEGAINNG